MLPALIYCSVCGAGNTAQASFCFSCGKKLLTGTPSSSTKKVSTHETGSLAPQHLLHQRYIIMQLLGEGGMGAVYKAQDTYFGHRRVAIKEMGLSHLSPHEVAEATERFNFEAQVLAGLQHPNLPGVHDFFMENGRWYLVMDYIRGVTLEDYIATADKHILPALDVVEIGIQLAKVLGYLHTRPKPVIFRDLKPLNVMITSEKHVYLIDFGIARHFKRGKAKDTLIYGSVGYAAPEQFGKEQTTPRADVYSLGVLLHQMLSGVDPQTNEPLFNFKPLRYYDPTLPETLTTLVSYMVDVNVHQRPGTMVGVKRELERIQTQLREARIPGRQIGRLRRFRFPV
jgi:serine/threonine protein kinase